MARDKAAEPVTLHSVPGLFIQGVPHGGDDHPLPLRVADPDTAAYLQATGAYVAGDAAVDTLDFAFDLQAHVKGRGETWPPHDSSKPADPPEPAEPAPEEAVI